jgi:haloacid dehalogenase-like hydrolase
VQGEIYERDYLSSVQPFNCIRDVFRILTESGARVALATDCKGLAFKRYISLLNADEFIAATACGDDVEHGKPDPRLVGSNDAQLAVPGSHSVRSVMGHTSWPRSRSESSMFQGFGLKVLRSTCAFENSRGPANCVASRTTRMKNRLCRGGKHDEERTAGPISGHRRRST